MQYYEVLGLDAPPKDRREIKKAYSKQLKVTRPEDDPDGFMRLRDAHDQALNVLRWAAEDAAYAAQQTPEETSEAEAQTDTGLTFEDMVEEDAPTLSLKPVKPTTYAIGAAPSIDVPPPEPAAPPPPPPLDAEIMAILGSPEKRNDRESWNRLFRQARELDIDDYVDFEALLLHRVLEVHDFFDESSDSYEQPEKQPKLINAAITASLFKTMNWDKVGKFNYQTTYRIEWLERRMGLRGNRPIQHATGPATPENTPSNLARWFWPVLGGLFAIALLFDLIAG